MARKYWLIAVILLLSLTAFALHRWGVTTYLVGVTSPLRHPSPHSQRHDDVFLRAKATKRKARGSALVVHGLNFDAEGLRELAQVFQSQGFNTYVPRLFAHRGRHDEMTGEVRAAWESQFKEWKHSNLEDPLICAGFSLGALLILEQQLHGHLDCKFYFGFSPALVLRTPDWVIEAANRLLPRNLTFPSAIPYQYRHFDLITLGPSYALFEILKRFTQSLTQSHPLPLQGYIAIDPNDEVINAPATIALVEKYFPKLRILRLKSLDMDEKHAHHILIDSKHVGEEQWQRLTTEIGKDLQTLGE